MLVDAECLRIDAVAGACWWLFGFTLCVYCLVGGFGVCLVVCCLLVVCVTLVCGIVFWAYWLERACAVSLVVAVDVSGLDILSFVLGLPLCVLGLLVGLMLIVLRAVYIVVLRAGGVLDCFGLFAYFW